jgi:DMSO/TMAO reductase YedYZ molybdopterin-dependent catalytic subunit
VIEPSVRPDAAVSHLIFGGLDDFHSVVTLKDALAEVLIADRLNGRPLDPDHGAPVRLVSPNQYGFVNTKHLCRIELHTAEPTQSYGSASATARVGLRLLGYTRFSRARVWEEERHPFLPAWALRLVSRVLIPPIGLLSALGSRSRGIPPSPPGTGSRPRRSSR